MCRHWSCALSTATSANAAPHGRELHAQGTRTYLGRAKYCGSSTGLRPSSASLAACCRRSLQQHGRTVPTRRAPIRRVLRSEEATCRALQLYLFFSCLLGFCLHSMDAARPEPQPIKNRQTLHPVHLCKEMRLTCFQKKKVLIRFRRAVVQKRTAGRKSVRSAFGNQISKGSRPRSEQEKVSANTNAVGRTWVTAHFVAPRASQGAARTARWRVAPCSRRGGPG
jgi:hypothetical protein